MHVVFLSHAHEDRSKAEKVCEALEKEGIACWLAARDIPPGQNWGDAIMEAIRAAKAMVVILSAHANTSRHVVREVNEADRLHLPMIPFRLDDATVPGHLQYLVSTQQSINAFTDPLDRHLAPLTSAVQRLLRTGPIASEPRSEAQAPSPDQIQPVQDAPKRRTRVQRTKSLHAPASAVAAPVPLIRVRPASLRLFISHSNSERDGWIPRQFVPILQAFGIQILQTNDIHGDVITVDTRERIDQADAVIAFMTLRDPPDASFNTHRWVVDEMIYATSIGKRVLEVVETGVTPPAGLFAHRPRLLLDRDDRLGCVAALMGKIREMSVTTLQLVAAADRLHRRLLQHRDDPALRIRYRTRANGIESPFRETMLRETQGSLHLDAFGVPDEALVEVEGTLDGRPLFSSGWQPAHPIAVQIPIA